MATSAEVSVSGRVMTVDGRGIRNVRVTMTGGNGAARTVLSSAFGYFHFSDVPIGETYIFSVVAKRCQFAQPSQVLAINEETEDIVFVALEKTIS